MNQQTMTLYTDTDFFSPYVMSVFVSLTEKALPFTLSAINLSTGENFQEAYTRLSTTRRVPTLVIDDFQLSESSAISEYLEERFPSPDYARIYPQDKQERARAREIQAWLRSDFMPIRTERSTEVVFAGLRLSPLSDSAQQAANKLISGLGPLLSDGRKYLFNEWCIADTDLALMLNRLALNGDPLPEYLRQYASYQWLRPSVQQWRALSQK
ncbi:glutathione transferase [Yersinia mollaretii]|uniref:Transferase n=1 Tax=Yersinia mollaretii TaxID=33060 RepID=A0AA36LKS0_YERMO|nr:glutathione transferase [Yersinia mollaretii]MDA5526961.1 glutathione transferase [Yersinia mollaretii]MDA5534438.1 glutathione transferase [Yersinia mollaretii]MDR7872356.1 glutathione transferase [Yersinia mollaretii]NIL02363.1 glutathione transferase [Yersinia mollaretii]PHZ31802.1 glutathione S-transferase [Yersinia mollaretii]